MESEQRSLHLQRCVCNDRIAEDKGNRCRQTTAHILGARFQIVTVIGEMGKNEVPVSLWDFFLFFFENDEDTVETVPCWQCLC